MNSFILLQRSVATLAVSILIGFSAGSAHAAPIYGTSADFIGSRSTDDGGLTFITTTGRTHNPGGNLLLSWNITLENGTYNYIYTINPTNLLSNQSISHLTLDLTDDCDGTKGCATNVALNGNPLAENKIEFGNKDGIIGSVKFDVGVDGINTYSFTSMRAPVWGDVFIKDGLWDAQNTGFGDRTSADKNLFIARPNGDNIGSGNGPVPIPMPGTLLLLALGLLAFARKRWQSA